MSGTDLKSDQKRKRSGVDKRQCMKLRASNGGCVDTCKLPLKFAQVFTVKAMTH